jgi:hypothetical protein
VTTSGGQPIRNATLTLTGGNLQAPITVQTGNFGTYSFTNLLAGETYTVRVDVKRYRFAQPTQIVVPVSSISNPNFAAIRRSESMVQGRKLLNTARSCTRVPPRPSATLL